MAVAFDNSVTVVTTLTTTGTSATTASFAISGSATVALALIELSIQASSDANITGTGTFTLGGSAFTLVSSTKKKSGGDAFTDGYVEIYYLQSPPTGSQTATWAPTMSIGGSFLCSTLHVATFTGSNTGTAPVVATTLANGNGVSSLTVSTTLSSGDLIAGICCNGTANPTVTTGTSIAAPTGSGATGSHNTRSAYNTGTGTVSIVFGTNSGDLSGATAVKVTASGAAATSLPTFHRPSGLLVR